MFIPRPPWANSLDRGLRGLGYLALAVFALHETGMCSPASVAGAWYNLMVHAGLCVFSAAGAQVCWLGRSQAEIVVLPLVLGFSSASWILILSAHGVGARAAILLSVIMFLSARMNWLRWLRHRALVMKALEGEGAGEEGGVRQEKR